MKTPANTTILALLALVSGVVAQDPDPARTLNEGERMVADLFEVCDLDGNGWISYREASAVFGIDKSRFREYDTNGDGRVDADEFSARRGRILRALGVLTDEEIEDPLAAIRPGKTLTLTPPARPTAAIPSSRATPQVLLQSHDGNGSGGLDRDEVAAMLADFDANLSPDVIVDRMDRDRSGELELAELAALGQLAGRLLPGPGPSLATTRTKTLPPPLLDAAGRPVRLAPHVGDPPSGPVGNFQRLDRDGDGYVNADDLRRLLAPARVGVRPGAVIAALDRDGDGRLDESEFLGSMGGR